MNAHQINHELCRALGIADMHHVSKVELILQAGELPTVLVRRIVLPKEGGAVADRLATVVDRLQLNLTPAP